ncbi:Syntaxin PEP12 [Yarrowia sp. C11]|nr:Syntaxin PEP12 [Yarrowia sp. E02]KAG5365352.1 Syntaxin PEP12 [Yarrowia sp. C11]
MSSFSDAVSLEAQPSYSDSPEFDRLNADISDTLFLLNNNLVTLGRLVKAAQNTGGKRDVVGRAIDLADETRDRFKTTGEDLKRLKEWEDTNAAQRFTQQKLGREFATALNEFQVIQKRLAEHEKQEIQMDKQAALESESRGDSQQQQQLLQQDVMTQDFMNQSETDQHMTLISEREEEIRNIEQGIEELNEIFSDLGTIVTQQGTIVDNIESNMYSIAGETRSAASELNRAARYQSRSRSRQCCLLLILVIVLAVILLATFI